ncbi:MAG: MBL fold metallo-hydrolase [Actinomycetota bacterium]|nr:MBL fold metallo-hydrolase [Thermoleophilia bacterium]MDA3005200.1 MBL fold metallo-hydrolase [Actinomycetota bacterium]
MAGGPWRWRVLVPAHRIIFGLLGDEVVESRAASTQGTFAAYRRLEGAVPGMIAWPNTVLLEGPEPIIVDPGYQTQGDMLDGALRAAGVDPASIRTVVMTHLHSDHLSALPQLPGVEQVWVHRDELNTPWARRQRGILDDAAVVVMEGAEGEIRPGLTWFHTPGHAPGHVAVQAECDDARVIVAGDTLGPDPAWFQGMAAPDGLENRDQHLGAWRMIRDRAPAVVVPGHYAPFTIP